MGILQNHSKGMSQVTFFNLVDINAVITNLSILNIIKSIDQIGNGGLSGSGGTDKGNLLSRRRKHFDVVKYHFLIIISEINTQEFHVSLKFRVSRGVIYLMVMLPCPCAGMMIGFINVSFFVKSSIDQSHISVIHFRFFIQ